VGTDDVVHRPTVSDAGERAGACADHASRRWRGRERQQRVGERGRRISERRVRKLITVRLERFADDVVAELEAGADEPTSQVIA
jgi:hypothetical protein